MKNISSLFFSALIFLTFEFAHAGLLMTYHQLALKDLDEMNELVTSKIKEAKKARSGKIVPLKEALQAVFSRPNEDGMVGKVYSPLVTELDRLDSLEKVYRDLTEEALNALKNTKNFKPDVQVTYSIFLENLVAEFKPSAAEEGLEKRIIEKIAQASVELTKDALKERKRRLMKEGESPSVLAEHALKAAAEKKALQKTTVDISPKVEAKSDKPVTDPSVKPGKEFETDENSK